jgi:flagellar M-ring protein FliF
MQLELEEHLESRAAEMLEPMVGAANVRVRVAAQLDYEQVQRRTQSVDPNEQVLTGEERSEIEPGDPSQGAASTIQHNTFDVTRSTEVSTRVPGALKRLTVAVALNEDVPRAGDPAALRRIEELVANAVGLDPSRGDAISVLAVPFATPAPILTPAPPPASGPLDLFREFRTTMIVIFGLVLAFVLAMRGLSFARTALPEAAPVLPRASYPKTAVAGAEAVPGLQGGEVATEAVLGGPQSDPTRVVRAWLGEG